MKYLEDHSTKRESRIEEGKYVPELFPCDRGYHREDNLWFVTLAPEQYSYGLSLFILIEPYDDITDPAIVEYNRLSEIFIGLHRLCKVLKDVLGAEKIYVSSLCDGVEHLHFHLIPRYHGIPPILGLTPIGQGNMITVIYS